MNLRIRRVRLAGVASLLDRHYASVRPARLCTVLGAFADREPRPVGALIVAFPALNARWREAAWPGEYRGDGDRESRRRIARRVNRDLRVIARVVVDPRFRGNGVGVSLVRAYLRSPRTRRTEAVASMGEHCPIFEHAGMRRVATHLIARDRTLERTLRRMRIRPDVLVDEWLLERAVRRKPELVPLLAAWARASRGTRAVLDRPDWLPEIAAQAARAILAPPAVFVTEKGISPRRTRRTRREEKSFATASTENTE
ncbi:MAG: hypothetical protein K2Y21_00135 [Phycisphaerales bacterium]|nr:hypothetical protein [Phycisphaerales bacterium]